MFRYFRRRETIEKIEAVKEVLHDFFVGTHPGPRFRVVQWGGAESHSAAVNHLQKALSEVAADSLSRQWLNRLCRSLIKGQRSAFGSTMAGSWAVCRIDREQNRDAFIARPTAIGTAILSLVLLNHHAIAKSIPGFRPALSLGLAFCAARMRDAHTDDSQLRQILFQGHVDDALRLDPDLCPDLADLLLSDAPFTLPPLADGTPGTESVEISLSRQPDWSGIKRIVSHPEGNLILLDQFDTATQRLVTMGPDGGVMSKPLTHGLDSVTASASVAPWGGYFIGFRSTYSHTARDGEQNFYETTCHLHTLPDGKEIASHSLFVGGSTSHVEQIFWDQAARRVILDCNFCLKIFLLDDGTQQPGAYAWTEGSYINTNFRFNAFSMRPHVDPQGDGFQFVSEIYDAWRYGFSGTAVTHMPSGRQWFLDRGRWAPWPRGYEDRESDPAIDAKAAAYSADGRLILVLGSDQVLRSWSADGFRLGPSRRIDLDDVKGMRALPNHRVVVWNLDRLLIAAYCAGDAPPAAWQTKDDIRSVQILFPTGLIAIHAWAGFDRGGSLHLLEPNGGAEIWTSSDHLGPVTEVHPFRGGVVLKDKQEEWWVVNALPGTKAATERGT